MQGDGTCLPFTHEAFDYVVSIWVLQHFLSPEDLARAVREMARTLRNGGRAILIEQISYTSYDQRRRPEEYLEAFADAGFRNVVEYSIRMGKHLTLYAIRYGLIPERLLMPLARREMARRQHQGPPRRGYGDHLFVFEKEIRSQ
jgi:SAM-dependent methyltransferase